MSAIGPYAPIVELASGGMGVIHVARRRPAGDLVVLKRVAVDHDDEPELLATLRDEARLGGVLVHPNIVHVRDVVGAGREIALVFDYVESLEPCVEARAGSAAALAAALAHEAPAVASPHAVAAVVEASAGALLAERRAAVARPYRLQ